MAYRRTAEVQARLDAQRDRIIGGAVELMRSSGYAGCTVSAVAASAGVASGTVYNHFAGKTDLLAEVFRAVVGREVDAVGPRLPRAVAPSSAPLPWSRRSPCGP